jgi:dTDP-4-dehydrorhamnose 3,5-epimerase
MSFDPDAYNELTVTEAPIPGMYVIQLPVHGDSRGWFKENYQKAKMSPGSSRFEPVQNNFSYNDAREQPGMLSQGKYVSLRMAEYLRMVDLRAGESFGKHLALNSILA